MTANSALSLQFYKSDESQGRPVMTLHPPGPNDWCYCYYCSVTHIYSGVRLLGNVVTLCLSFRGTAKLFSKAAELFYIPTSSHFTSFSLLCGSTLTSMHNYWKNHSFDYTDLCWQSDGTVQWACNRSQDNQSFCSLSVCYRQKYWGIIKQEDESWELSEAIYKILVERACNQL